MSYDCKRWPYSKLSHCLWHFGSLFVVIVTQDVRVLVLAEEEVLTMTC